MKIGFCYDTKEDYGLKENDLDFTDFTTLHTVSSIKRAMEFKGFEVIMVGNIEKLKKKLISECDIDLFFNIAEGHGSRNREALIPSILEIYRKNHTGSDTYGMAINLHKHHTKALVNSLGIKVPKGIFFNKLDENVLSDVKKIGFPVVLKPNYGGGSMGVCLIQNIDEFIEKSTELFSKYGPDLVAEEYIDGCEISVPIIGNGNSTEALGVVVALTKDGNNISLYDSLMKYEDEIIRRVKTDKDGKKYSNIAEDSVKIHRFLGLFDYSRMDFRISEKGAFFLEANTMPSLSRGGTFEICAEKKGMSYPDVIEAIINAAIERTCNKI